MGNENSLTFRGCKKKLESEISISQLKKLKKQVYQETNKKI